MSFLIPDRVRKISVGGVQLELNEKIIPDSARSPRQIASWVPAGGPMKPNAPLGGNGRPRGITIHNTNDITVPAGTNPAEQYSRATWPNANMRGVVVHFYVWRRDIWQILSLTEQGWHASDGAGRRPSNRPRQTIGGNLDTIAIEAIGNHAQTEETASMLSAWILRENGLDPRTDLYTHNFFMGLAERIVPGAAKNCPIYILPRWGQFKDTVARFYNTLAGSTSPEQFRVGDTVLFTGGPVFATSIAAQGSLRASALCKITRIAQGARRPYHLESITPGVIFGWVDAENVSPAPGNTPDPNPDCAEISRQLEALQIKHAKLRAELSALAKSWPV